MEKKIVIGFILFALLILIANTNSVKAEEDNYTFEEWCADNGYLCQNSINSNPQFSDYDFVYNENYTYVVNGNSVYVFNSSSTNLFISGNTLAMHRNYSGYSSMWYYTYDTDGWKFSSSCNPYFGTDGFVLKSWGEITDFKYTNKDIYTDNSLTDVYYAKSVKSEPIVIGVGIEHISEDGFYYNGVHYEWNSAQKAYMIIENLTDYLVFYDDYNKQLIFVWAFDDFMAQAKNQKTGLRFYSYYYEFITETNNSSVLPYCYSVYQIDSDGTLKCINDLRNEKAENNHQFSFGWTNPIYEPQLDNIDNFSTYEEYVLNNNLIASNCYIYNNSGVLVKSPVTLNNELITPDEVPDTEMGTLKYFLYEKLPIIRTVEVFIKKFNVELEAMKESGEPPEIIMKFDNYYGFGGEVNVLDVAWYEDYREPVKAILSAILIIPFILWVYKKGLPEAIGGI